jgi:hypothetical protein
VDLSVGRLVAGRYRVERGLGHETQETGLAVSRRPSARTGKLVAGLVVAVIIAIVAAAVLWVLASRR